MAEIYWVLVQPSTAYRTCRATGLRVSEGARHHRCPMLPANFGVSSSCSLKPLLDADLYVPGLIEGTFGSNRWMQQIGKLGGLSRSAIKAKASRENGKRGGRPKKREAA